MDDKFEATSATISIEFSQKGFRVDGKVVKVQVHFSLVLLILSFGILLGKVSTIHYLSIYRLEEKFRAMTQAYYRNSSGCILVRVLSVRITVKVYDITDLESFRNLETWLDAVRSVV